MILLADSGSTKTDWALLPCTVDEGEAACFQTQGINPVLMDDAAIVTLLKEQLCPYLTDRDITSLFFYGAGCRPEQVAKMQGALTAACFNAATTPPPIHIHSDMLGAARALCQHSEGIACILGTGANSCLYDGQDIVRNVRSLGFILGDEGSGSALGRIFLGDVLKGLAPKELSEAFFDRFRVTPDDIMDAVYNNASANRNLSTYSFFLSDHLDNGYVTDLVDKELCRFFERNLCQYADYDKMPVAFVGAVATTYSELLLDVAQRYGVRIQKIVRSSMPGLVTYHTH